MINTGLGYKVISKWMTKSLILFTMFINSDISIYFLNNIILKQWSFKSQCAILYIFFCFKIIMHHAMFNQNEHLIKIKVRYLCVLWKSHLPPDCCASLMLNEAEGYHGCFKPCQRRKWIFSWQTCVPYLHSHRRHTQMHTMAQPQNTSLMNIKMIWSLHQIKRTFNYANFPYRYTINCPGASKVQTWAVYSNTFATK